MKLPWDQIEELTKYLKDNKLSEITIELDGGKISVKKDSGSQFVAAPAPIITDGGNAAPAVAQAKSQVSNLKDVKAPMVGTFYSSSSPDAPPFVKVGSKVKKGEVLCIIEAMKIMNELPSDFDGTVKEISVTDGSIVEFGQALFRIDPS